MYLRQAEELNAAKDVDGALDAYNKCLNAAERVDNPAASAKAHYQMGMLYHKHGKWTVRSDTLKPTSELDEICVHALPRSLPSA